MARTFPFLLFVAAALSGCAAGPTTISMSVSSLATPEAAAQRNFVLMAGNKGVDNGDLQFQEYARQVSAVLRSKGFVEKPSIADANLVVFVAYGIGAPQSQQVSYSLPTFGQTGVASSTTYGTVSRSGNFQANTTYTPTYGVTGETQITDQVTTFSRFALITGYDAAAVQQHQVKQLWSTSISSVGSTGDLRLIFPYLLQGAAPYLAIDSGRAVPVSLPTTLPR